jgi:glycosyltransferase involved in cell wall biosynthesis
MKLAVDACWMVGQTRGMAQYARALLEPVKHEISALLPQGYPATDYHSIYGGSGFFPYWEQMGLNQLCSKHQIKYLICPYNTAPLNLPPFTKLILVVHDLIYLESLKSLPLSISMYQNLGRIYRRMIVPKVILKAHHLIAVSHYTRQQISQVFKIPTHKITLLPNSIADDWRVAQPLPEAERAPYILTVSGGAPHKNLPMLLRAFAAFKQRIPADSSAPMLRIVGINTQHQKHFQKLATNLGIKQPVVFEPFLEEALLKQRYQHARLFVFPSLIEGFGIPLMEAMASGTPVVCSNTTAFPEVIGDAGWLFNPHDLEDMTNTLYTAWMDRDAQTKYAWQGLERVQRFSQTLSSESIRAFWKSL